MWNTHDQFHREDVEYLCEIAMLIEAHKIPVHSLLKKDDEMLIDDMLCLYQFILSECSISDQDKSLLQIIYDCFEDWKAQHIVKDFINNWKNN